MKLNVITMHEVEQVAFQLARELMSAKEPIPDFHTRFPHVLESCIATPFQRFSKKDLYPGLIPKASMLFYLLIKNHPFQNGNKRIAVTTLMFFLYKNKKWLTTDTKEFYNFSVWVAQSPASLKTEVVAAVQKFIKNHITDLK